MNDRDETLLESAPGVMRLLGAVWWRTAGWTVGASLRAGRRLFAMAEADDRAGGERGDGGASGRSAEEREHPGASSEALRERGAELLRQSADVRFDEDTHPAYARILDDLAPDEGRILRLLAVEGPQPSVDVRTSRPFNIGSRLVAPGLTMIGEEAGCRHRDRTHSYLNNLFRLGLIWFSRERLEDPLRYQVLESQPEVAEAMNEAGRGRTIRRTIHLTPFGEDFCRMCLPLETDEAQPRPADGARARSAGRSEAAVADRPGETAR